MWFYNTNKDTNLTNDLTKKVLANFQEYDINNKPKSNNHVNSS